MPRHKINKNPYTTDDWDRVVKIAPLSNVQTTFLERQIRRHNNQEKKKLVNNSQSTPVTMSKIYKFKNGKWVHIGYRCHDCNKTMSDPVVVDNHKNICERINTISKKEDIDMPIQTIMIKGERYYRWGDSGKPYKDRADAEKQATAAYASGYKEPKKDMKQK